MEPDSYRKEEQQKKRLLNNFYNNSPGMEKKDYATAIEEEDYVDPSAVIKTREEAEEIKEIEETAKKHTEKQWERGIRALSAVGALNLENLKKYMDFKNSSDKSKRLKFSPVSKEENKKWLEKLQLLKHEHRKEEIIKDKLGDITPYEAGMWIVDKTLEKALNIPGELKEIRDKGIVEPLLKLSSKPTKEDIKDLSDPSRFKTGTNYFISRETGDKWFFDDKKDEWYLVEKTWSGFFREGKGVKGGGLHPVWSPTEGIARTIRTPNRFEDSKEWKKSKGQ